MVGVRFDLNLMGFHGGGGVVCSLFNRIVLN